MPVTMIRTGMRKHPFVASSVFSMFADLCRKPWRFYHVAKCFARPRTRRAKKLVSGMSKRELLSFLDEVEHADAERVAEELAMDYAAAAMSLLRLTRQGLVER